MVGGTPVIFGTSGRYGAGKGAGVRQLGRVGEGGEGKPPEGSMQEPREEPPTPPPLKLEFWGLCRGVGFLHSVQCGMFVNNKKNGWISLEGDV